MFDISSSAASFFLNPAGETIRFAKYLSLFFYWAQIYSFTLSFVGKRPSSKDYLFIYKGLKLILDEYFTVRVDLS